MRLLSAAIIGVIFCATAIGASAAPNTRLLRCDPITGCPPVIAKITHQSKPAYVLNDGYSTALIAPSKGRVMSFGLSDQSTYIKSAYNWLWTNRKSTFNGQSWHNWGGAKTWLAPQKNWPRLAGHKWPPDLAWTDVVKSEVQTGGFLRMVGKQSSQTGIRLIRQYGHAEDGTFFIRQTAQKKSGKSLQAALWSVTQIKPPDAVFFVLDKKSTFAQSVQQLSGSAKPRIIQRQNIACYVPGKTASLKIGISTQTPVLAALRGNLLFVTRATPAQGIYPDSTSQHKNGFSIEIFDSGKSSHRYLELEHLSPLRRFAAGASWTSTVHWSIRKLSSQNLESQNLWDDVRRILTRNPS